MDSREKPSRSRSRFSHYFSFAWFPFRIYRSLYSSSMFLPPPPSTVNLVDLYLRPHSRTPPALVHGCSALTVAVRGAHNSSRPNRQHRTLPHTSMNMIDRSQSISPPISRPQLRGGNNARIRSNARLGSARDQRSSSEMQTHASLALAHTCTCRIPRYRVMNPIRGRCVCDFDDEL
jgi:hypothetical protein